MFASRAAAAMTSLVTAALATGAIMLACGYYRGTDLLPTQLASIAAPVGLPLLIASIAIRHRRSIWLATAAILAVGWVYVVYAETQAGAGGGPSFAVVIGWFASVIALATALILTTITLLRH